MKKYLLIVLMFMLFLFGEKVYAKEATFYPANSTPFAYMKYDGRYYYFMNSYIIRNKATSIPAYCIQPFVPLVEGTNYQGFSEYDSRFGLSKEVWDKVELLAYYGFRYPGHFQDEWFLVTQLMIWRTVDPDHTFEWINNVNDRVIIHPYQRHFTELENLVNNHYTLPNINSKLEMNANDTLEIEDSTGVLNNFKIKESTIDAEIVDNTLVIHSKEKEGEIVLVKEGKDKQNVEFFYNSASQSVVERGNPKPIEYKIKVGIHSGSIEITKVDKDTSKTKPQGKAQLVGAVYEVMNSKNEVVGEITIGEDCKGMISQLPYGSYTLKETKAGEGYYLDEEEYSVEINEETPNVQIELSNKVVDSLVRIIKYYGTLEEYFSQQMKVEEGVEFEFYDSNDQLVYRGMTDELGVLEVVLPYGTYTLRQLTTIEGYEKVQDLEFVIDEESNVLLEIPLYDLKVDVPNTEINEDELLGDLLTDAILSARRLLFYAKWF